MKRVGIVGGGASGMTAAIAAARAGAAVTLFEHTSKPGKKILSTGNGRCNLTNAYLEESCYHGAHPEFAMEVISRFDRDSTLTFFESIGICPVKNGEGYYYPRSMQASAVSRALIRELEFLGVRVICGAQISKIRKEPDGFLILAGEEKFMADSLILACGGRAAPKSGSDGSGYGLARQLGLTVVPPVPALVPLTSPWKGFKELGGIRVRGKITVCCGAEQIASASGELQLCDYGLSGIPVFQVSGVVARKLKESPQAKLEAELSFTEEFTEATLKQWMSDQIRRRPSTRCGDFLMGLLPEKLGLQLFRRLNIPFDREVGRLGNGDLDRLVRECLAFRVPISGTLGFDRAQVCSGGVDTSELSPLTLEALKVPGLYAAGELVDVDGICGGYNLQFAWSSGYLAGKAAAERAGRRTGK